MLTLSDSMGTNVAGLGGQQTPFFCCYMGFGVWRF
jgi:hypothetical protein